MYRDPNTKTWLLYEYFYHFTYSDTFYHVENNITFVLHCDILLPVIPYLDNNRITGLSSLDLNLFFVLHCI